MKRVAAPLVCLMLVAVGCGRSRGSTVQGAARTLTVFAASSLTGAFTQIGHEFAMHHSGVHVVFNFGASDTLAGQIDSEGGADVFASASPTWMDQVATKGPGVSGRADFAQNRLVVIVPPADPAGIRSFQDLAKPGVQLVLAAKGVPVGDYARQALTTAGIAKQAMANVVSNEPDDASIVQKITSGEADAGIVYVSDVTSTVASQVKAIPVPKADNVIATYPIAVVQGAKEPTLARQFVAAVTGPVGQATLKRFGFLPPP